MKEKGVWKVIIKFFRKKENDINIIRVCFNSKQEAEDYIQKLEDDINEALECGEKICINGIDIDINEMDGHKIAIKKYIISSPNGTNFCAVDDIPRDNRYKYNNLRNEVI